MKKSYFKKSYIRLLVFELILFIVFFLNSFVWNVLNDYNLIIFLGGSIVAFKFVFGLEKDRHRYVQDVVFDLIILLIIFFALYYLFGIVIGFYRISDYYNWYGLKNFIVPAVLTIIFREYFRYQVVTKSENSKLLVILSIVLFTFIDVSTPIYYGVFSSSYGIFMFIALNLLPSIARNVTATFIALKFGYKPNFLWMLVMQMYSYLIPIIPNANEYIYSLVGFVVPLLILWRSYLFVEKTDDKELIRTYFKKNFNILAPISTVFILVVIYLISGYFSYSALVIASGSMSPKLKRGDMIVIERIEDNYGDIEVGEILTYNYNGVVIVHRIINIIEDNGEYYFYTQGDANENQDNYVIEENMIIGIVKSKIPYVGYPTVWLNEL